MEYILPQLYFGFENKYCPFDGILSKWENLTRRGSVKLYVGLAASKAALCRFAESVNIELEVSGTANRILDVSPGSIKGTRFNGGENQPEKKTAPTAKRGAYRKDGTGEKREKKHPFRNKKNVGKKKH